MRAPIRLGVDGREIVGGVRTGIGRYLLEILRAAVADGWECLVYVDGPCDREALPARVRVRPFRAALTAWWDQLSLPRRLARDGISVFLSPYYKGPLAAPCPVVLTIHDLYFIAYLGRRRPLYDGVVTRLARLYARRAAAIIADSEYSRRSIVERLGIDRERIHVVPVGLGAEFGPTPLADSARARYRLPDSYVLYLGNFKPHKNLDRLLEAWARLAPALRAAHGLVLAGGEAEGRARLTEEARRLGIADGVVFPGTIDPADLPGLYSAGMALVLPSLEEGFGLPALEAMACGTPVVAANRAALPEVAGEAALLVEPEDPGAIARALERILRDPDLRGRLRARGLARAREFPQERTTGRVLAILRDALERRPTGSVAPTDTAVPGR